MSSLNRKESKLVYTSEQGYCNHEWVEYSYDNYSSQLCLKCDSETNRHDWDDDGNEYSYPDIIRVLTQPYPAP